MLGCMFIGGAPGRHRASPIHRRRARAASCCRQAQAGRASVSYEQGPREPTQLSQSPQVPSCPALSKVPHRCGEPQTRRKLRVTGAQQNQSRPAAKDHGLLRPDPAAQPGGPGEPEQPPAAPGRDPGHVVRSIPNAKEEDPAPRNTRRGRRRAEPVRLLAGRGRGGYKFGGGRRRRVVRRPAERL